MSSENELEKKEQTQQIVKSDVNAIFNDFEAKSNFVGFYDLLLKVDKRINPSNHE